MNELSNDDINKKIDNGLKKKELEKKYGASFSEKNNLHPDFENSWLQSIENFEQASHGAKKITVWESIGKPKFKKLSELNPENISIELDGLYKKLNENNISLDTLCEVDKAELYRFITEELFDYEMDDIKVEGMMSCFIYEEFHPNSRLDIEQTFDHFFWELFNKSDGQELSRSDLTYVDTENFLDFENNILDEEILLSRIKNFIEPFDYFEIVTKQILNISINKDETDAQLDFNIHYKGCFENSQETIDYRGNGVFSLKPCKYGGWSICSINMPGLII